MKARGADETELLGLAATVPFDDRLQLQARVDDLSRELMVAFLREVKSDLAAQADDLSLVDLGRQMHMVGGSPEAPFPVTAEVGRLVAALEGEQTRLHPQEAMGLHHEMHFRKAYLGPALDAGLVEMTLPDKPKSSKQRYRLTTSGVTRKLGRG